MRNDVAAAGAVVRAHKGGVAGATAAPTGDPFVEEVCRRSHRNNQLLLLPGQRSNPEAGLWCQFKLSQMVREDYGICCTDI